MECHACRLRENCRAPVPGQGSIHDIMFIGQAPGKVEDKLNKPFVGPSGNYLRRAIQFKDYYITNVVKCYPPKDRAPFQDEIDTCVNLWLSKEIKFIKPKRIILIGQVAKNLKVFHPEIFGEIPTSEIEHPSYMALRQGRGDEWIEKMRNLIGIQTQPIQKKTLDKFL
jgi:DNA polymerase